MPLLYPNLRITQIFGANTDVGKTLLTTALLRSTALGYGANPSEHGNRRGKQRVFYLKPVSTGPEEESDVGHVLRNTKPYADSVSAHYLYQYRESMSPHLAAKLAPDLPFPETNDELVRSISSYAKQCLSSLDGERGALYVETAGGVHSPALHYPHTQSTFLQSLRLPSVLMAAPQLGGIGTTISAYESLLLRGYDVQAVLCLNHDYYRNHDFLGDYFRDRGISFYTLPTPPEKHGTVAEDGKRLEEWYRSIEGEQSLGGEAVDHLEKLHDARIAELDSMAQRTLDKVWWPFTQHGLVNKKEDVMVVDSAYGDNFDAYYPASSSRPRQNGSSLLNPYFDGSASWFTQSHGHANTDLTLAAASAAGRYGHVLFPSGTNKPALDLTEKLLETAGKGWASRVFFSDDGSTGVEVALKMALRASGRRYGWDGEVGGEVGVIGLRGGYHGDTIGAMDAAEASTYNKVVDWYKGRGHWFSPPVVQFLNGQPTISTTAPDKWSEPPEGLSAESTENGWTATFESLQDIYNVSDRLRSPLADYYRHHLRSTLERLIRVEKRKFGALIIEPTCLGAGGMVFVDPLFQACMVEICRASSDLYNSSIQAAAPSFKDQLATLDERDTNEWQGLPIIYDEVFSGLHRFGYHTAASVLHYQPDISIYAKILTGGLVPLAATLASSSVFNAFVSDRKVDALLHGHSYTAHPIGCAVALKSLQLIEDQENADGWKDEKQRWGVDKLSDKEGARWSFWDKSFVESMSKLPGIQASMAMGTVLALELADSSAGYDSHTSLNFLTPLRQEMITSSTGEFEDFAIHARPLGNVVYIMCTLFTRPAVLRVMEQRLMKSAEKLQS